MEPPGGLPAGPMGFPKTYKEVGVTRENQPNRCLLRHSPKVLDAKRCPGNGGGPGWQEWLSIVLTGGVSGARGGHPIVVQKKGT